MVLAARTPSKDLNSSFERISLGEFVNTAVPETSTWSGVEFYMASEQSSLSTSVTNVPLT